MYHEGLLCARQGVLCIRLYSLIADHIHEVRFLDIPSCGYLSAASRPFTLRRRASSIAQLDML